MPMQQRQKMPVEVLWEFIKNYDLNQPIWKQQIPSDRPGVTASWNPPGATGEWGPVDQPPQDTIPDWSPPPPSNDFSKASSLALPPQEAPAAAPTPLPPPVQPVSTVQPPPVSLAQQQRPTALSPSLSQPMPVATPASMQVPQVQMPQQAPAVVNASSPESAPIDRYLAAFSDYLDSGGRKISDEDVAQRTKDARSISLMNALASLAANAGTARTWGELGGSVAGSLAQGASGYAAAPYTAQDEQAKTAREDLRDRLGAAQALSLAQYRNQGLADQRAARAQQAGQFTQNLGQQAAIHNATLKSQAQLADENRTSQQEIEANRMATALITANQRGQSAESVAAIRNAGKANQDDAWKKYVEERKFLTEQNDPLKNLGTPGWTQKSPEEIDRLARASSNYTDGMVTAQPQGTWYTGSSPPPTHPDAKQYTDGRWYDPKTRSFIMTSQ